MDHLLSKLRRLEGVTDRQRAALIWLAERGGTVAESGEEITRILGINHRSGGQAVMSQLIRKGLVRISRRALGRHTAPVHEYQIVWSAILEWSKEKRKRSRAA